MQNEVCPECGSNEIWTYEFIVQVVVYNEYDGIEGEDYVGDTVEGYECQRCGYRWGDWARGVET